MIKHLEIDQETREVRLVMLDLYDGWHERDEFRVVSDRTGEVVHERTPGEWDHLLGLPVHGTAGNWYIYRPPHADTIVRVQHTAVGPTAKAECRRNGHPRRKCQLCTELAA